MKKILFYKWYGVIIAVIIQSAFFYIYYKLEINLRKPLEQGLFIGIYQVIFVVTAIHYILLYRAYIEFEKIKRQNEENDNPT